MKIILIYLTLVTFYINQVLGSVGFLSIKGVSLFNLNIYLLLFVWAVDILQRRKFFQSNNVNKYIVLMGFIVLTSIFVKILHGEIPNISIKKEIVDFKQWLNPVLLFFILFNIIDDEETCNRTLWGLFFLFFALIITQLLATFGFIDYQVQTIENFGRVGGFGAPGEFAITLALFFPFLCSGSLFTKRSGLHKTGSILLAFLTLVGLINAGSRNGAISFLVCTIVYFLILKRKKIMGMLPIAFLIYLMIGAGATAFFVSPSSVKTEVSERFDLSSYDEINKFTSGRILLLNNGWKLFVDSPIFGHGRNSFKILSYLRGYPFYGAPHNEYLRCLVDHGLIGLIIFSLIFFKIFQNIWQSLEKTKDPNGKYLYISYIAGLCGYMTGMFATNTDPSLYIFWIYTAVVYKHAQLDMDRKETYEVKSESITALAGMTKSV
jgi:oligosaccharide repeat unit polymerase